MRRIASLGLILLGLAGCQHIPEDLRVVVDGSTIVFRKKPDPEAPVPHQTVPETPPAADVPEW